MVMQIEPIDRCIQKLKEERTYDAVIYLTPDGTTLNQKQAILKYYLWRLLSEKTIDHIG